MKERSDTARVFSRRKFIYGAAGLVSGAFVGYADHNLKDGLMFDPPNLTPHFKRVNAALPGINLPLDRAIELGYQKEFIKLNDRSFLHINSDGELIVQHVDAVFDLEREYNIPHRSGNRGYLIDEARELDADGFDIDANDTGDNILAEHGLVASLDLKVVRLGGVLDIGEGEVRSRIPRSVVDVLDQIGSVSNPQNPYVIEIELKRGNYTNTSTVIEVIDAISRNGLPTRVFSTNQENVDNLFLAAQSYARRSGTL